MIKPASPQAYERYTNNLPYFINGNLREDHKYRIITEKYLFEKYCQDSNNITPRVLDIGCHDGGILKIITQNYNAKLSGIDIVENAIAKAKTKGINTYVADIEKGIPFKNSSFDIIIAGEIVEHLYDPKYFLTEAHRTLDTNGGIIVTVPNVCSLRNRFKILCGQLPHHYNSSIEEKWGDHIRLFTKDSMYELLEGVGFRVDSITSNGMLGKGFFKRTIPQLADFLIFYAKKE